jgi:protein PhnA
MSIEATLQERSNKKCELCSSDQELGVMGILPQSAENSDQSIYLCKTCSDQINNPESIQVNHWHCLNDSMWSEFPAVQVMAWRMLKRLNAESWAQDLLEQLYLSDENLMWAQAGLPEESENNATTLDCNGAALLDGDNVTLIKDLDVKGANFTAKRGILVKNISLTDDPTHIEGRVSGQQIYLKTCFLKKA